MHHIARHMIEGGRTIDHSRPDFEEVKDLWAKGCISKEDYEKIMEYTERPYVDGLRPSGFVTEKVRKRTEAAERKLNELVVVDKPRDRQRTIGRGKVPKGTLETRKLQTVIVQQTSRAIELT